MINRSKIICTIGPTSKSTEKLKELVKAGMNCARLNFSHGTADEQKTTFLNIRKYAPEIAILCDIQGPKIRVGDIKDNHIHLVAGQSVSLIIKPCCGTKERITVNYDKLIDESQIGDKIYINDGLICLEVSSIDTDALQCKIIAGGIVSAHKGVNLPSEKISMKAPTEKDISDLAVIASLNSDFLAASFVSNANDVNRIRKILNSHGNTETRIIAKIERPIAITNFDEILEAADGIMVARGDLGVEVEAASVPFMQKDLILKANTVGKPIIVATQMLESMIKAPVPTRAEVSDVYNAIMDGADAVMLSAETASGDYPIESASMMQHILTYADENIPVRDPVNFHSEKDTNAEFMGHLIYAAATEWNRKNQKKEKPLSGYIICMTDSGYSARMISKYRPELPIIAATVNPVAAQRMILYWGVTPLLMPEVANMSGTKAKAMTIYNKACDEGLIKKGEFAIYAESIMEGDQRTSSVRIIEHIED